MTAMTAALSLAAKLGPSQVKAAAKAIRVAKAASVAAPIIWNVIANWDWSKLDKDKLMDEVFGDDMERLGKALEGGHRDYVAYVGRASDGAIDYVGITSDFKQLTANHGGLDDLSVVGGPEPVPLGQARALAEAVIRGAYDRMDGGDLANTRHVIDPANNLYVPAMRWASEQLDRTGFKW
jgi:hypothetical protein